MKKAITINSGIRILCNEIDIDGDFVMVVDNGKNKDAYIKLSIMHQLDFDICTGAIDDNIEYSILYIPFERVRYIDHNL